jgi:hypothetical protein
VRRLYKRYGAEIWSACRGLAQEKLGSESPLTALARLELSVQAAVPKTFEEFLVRNPLKRAALDVLSEGDVIPAGEITDGLTVRETLFENQKAQVAAFQAADGRAGSIHIYTYAYFESKLGRLVVKQSMERQTI